MAGLSGFSYYKAITISTTNCDADLTNFPVYVPIVNDADIGGECLATGYDIQFADATNDNVLTFERLAGFAVASGQANGDFYVLVPTVAGAADTVIRCYYGKAGATDVSSPENTFLAANGWSAVWHLEESGNPYLDATSNNNDSTGGTYPDQATGKIVKAQDFDSANTEFIQINDNSSLDFGDTDDMTMTAWIKMETLASWNIACKWGAGGEIFIFYGLSTIFDDPVCRAKLELGDGADFAAVTDYDHGMAAGTWYHIAGRLDENNSEGLNIFTDGVKRSGFADPTSVGSMVNAAELIIGARDLYGTNPYNGLIDELRVFKGLLSDAWIKFEYYNSHDGHAAGNELTWGAETSTAAVPYIPKVIGPF